MVCARPTNIKLPLLQTFTPDTITTAVKALGASSSDGKSTLIQILLGLHPYDSGDIYFDDIFIKDIGFEKIRENTATVLQNPVLFNDTVRVNLALGKNISEEKLWHALDIAQLDKQPMLSILYFMWMKPMMMSTSVEEKFRLHGEQTP